jgi:hypothetical protein
MNLVLRYRDKLLAVSEWVVRELEAWRETIRATFHVEHADDGTHTAITATSVTATGAVAGATLAGTLTTAAQPNITSVGTLGSLTVTGTMSAHTVEATADLDVATVDAEIVSASTYVDTATVYATTVDTSTLKAGAGSASAPSVAVGQADVGFYGHATNHIIYVTTGNDIWGWLSADVSGSVGRKTLGLAGGAWGTGATYGNQVTVGRNSSGNGAPGYLGLEAKDGTYYYLWVDSTGDLRVGTTIPTETAGDTGGTIVGTQS